MPVSGRRREVCLWKHECCYSYFSAISQFAVVTEISLFLYTEGINIPADQPINKLKNLEDVVVPTMEIKVT